MLIAAEDQILDHEQALAWHTNAINEGLLPFWVISKDLVHHPHIFIARPWAAPAHGVAIGDVHAQAFYAILIAPTLDAIRGLLPPGLNQIVRTREDLADIIEKWMT